MSLKASALKSNDSQKKAIAREVVNILARIDDELKVAHEQGKHSISTFLPITFSVPYMANKDAQRIVYFKILDSLILREYNVEIELKKDATVYHITWLTRDEKEEIDVQNLLLAKHTKKEISKINLKAEDFGNI